MAIITQRILTKVNTKAGKSPLALSSRRCLITGFDSFGKFNFNPSEWIAQSMPAEIMIQPGETRLEIKSLVLPTCCKTSWQKVKRALSASPYDVLILTGLAGKRSKMNLERFALNIRDYHMEDNGGHIRQDEPIAQDGPDALRTNLPLVDMHKVLQMKGFPVEISNFAGSFICNEVFYRALHYQQTCERLRAVLFVHVPDPLVFADTMEKSNNKEMAKIKSEAARKEKSLETMAEGVIEVAKYCVRHIAE